MTHELAMAQSELSWGDTYMKYDRMIGVLDGVASLRVHRVRSVVGWVFVEGHKDIFVWGNVDRFVAACLDRGIKPLLDVSTPRPTGYSKSASNYAECCKQVALRYGVTGFTYAGKFYPPINPLDIEIFNEPNLSSFWSPVDPVAYVEFLKAAYAAIKSVAPGTMSNVVSAGIAGAVGNDNLGWVMDSVQYAKGMIAAGAVGNFDSFGWHPYTTDEAFILIPPDINANAFVKEQKVRDLLDANGAHDNDIWWTEWGSYTSVLTPEQQAEYDAIQWGIYQSLPRRGPAFRYNQSDTHNKPTSKNDTWGITYFDLTPKPSYWFFNSVTSPVTQGALSATGTLTARVTPISRGQLTSVGTLSTKIRGRPTGRLSSAGSLSVVIGRQAAPANLSGAGSLSVVLSKQKLYTYDFGGTGSSKPTSLFTDFGPYGYSVSSSHANSNNPTANGSYYDGGIYNAETYSADQYVEVEQANFGSFADRSIMCVGRSNAAGTQAIFATMRWGGSDSSQILMLDGSSTPVEMAHGTEKLNNIGDKLGLRIDGDTYTVLKNGVDTDCQWIDVGHTYTGRTNRHTGFGFQHKRVGGVNYGSSSIQNIWRGGDLRSIAIATPPVRQGVIFGTGSLTVKAIINKNGILSAAGTLTTKAVAAKKGNLSAAGTLSTKTVAAKVPALSSVGALTTKTVAAKKGNLAGAGTLTVSAGTSRTGILSAAGTLSVQTVNTRIGALASTGALATSAVAAKKGNLSAAGTLSTKTVAAKVPALSSVGALTTKTVAAKKGNLAGAGTLSVTLIPARTGALSATGTLSTTVIAHAANPQLSGAGTLSVSIKRSYDYSFSVSGGAVKPVSLPVGQPTIVSSASAAANTVTMPTHAAGDFIIVVSTRDGSATAPTLVAGFLSWVTVAGTTCSKRVAIKLAASSSEVTGTWTNATGVEVIVLRGVDNPTMLAQALTSPLILAAIASGTGASGVITYPAATFTKTNSTSLALRTAFQRDATNLLTNTPSGYDAVTGVATELRAIVSHTNVAANPTADTQATNGTTGWIAATIEALAATTDFGENQATTVSSSTMREGDTHDSVNGDHYSAWLYPDPMNTDVYTARANSGALNSGSTRGMGVVVGAPNSAPVTKALIAIGTGQTTTGFIILTWDGVVWTSRATATGAGTSSGTADDIGLRISKSAGIYTYTLQKNGVDTACAWTDSGAVFGTPGPRWGPAFKHNRTSGVQGVSPGVDEIWCVDT